jgi:hypothetical protein
MLPGIAELVHHRRTCVRHGSITPGGGTASDAHLSEVSDLYILNDGQMLDFPTCVSRVNKNPQCFAASELNTLLLSQDVHAAVRADVIHQSVASIQ